MLPRTKKENTKKHKKAFRIAQKLAGKFVLSFFSLCKHEYVYVLGFVIFHSVQKRNNLLASYPKPSYIQIQICLSAKCINDS